MTTEDFPRETHFGPEEYGARMDAVRRLMSGRGIDVLVTSHPGNICYLTGHFTWNLWDPMFLVVPQGKEPRIYLWQFEAGRYMASGTGPEAAYWELHEDPVEFVTQAMAAGGLKGGRVAIDTGTTYTPFDMMERLKVRLDAEAAQGLVEEARLVKSPAEIALLEDAALMTDAGMRAGLDAVAVGVSDYQISAKVAEALTAAGSEFLVVDPVVCVGWRSGTPHSHRGGTIVQDGDTVFFEFGGSKGRYTCPLMRCGVAGATVRPEIAELVEHSIACIDALIAAARPGARACDVAAAGKSALAPVLDRIVFHYTFGYPVGIGFPPSWLENPGFLITAQNQGELREGMVFHLPLMLRVLGRYGAGFSETIVITRDGARPLSQMPRRLGGR
jgi:Xaa-Pro dipeptidase